MRDMHDGIGGHLIGLKALAQRNPNEQNPVVFAEHIDKALIDLRFVINSLDSTSQTVSSLLGAMRVRWQQLSSSQNIELIWRVARQENLNKLGPSKTLQLMRILEESFTNCLKHSGANTITISSGHTTDVSWIEVADNGIKEWEESNGNGIANMHYRAEQIGGILTIKKNANSCTLRLEIKLNSKSE